MWARLLGRATAYIASLPLFAVVLATPQDSAVGAEQSVLGDQDQGGTVGFVFTRLSDATTDRTDCPTGMNQSLAEVMLDRLAPEERAKQLLPENLPKFSAQWMYVSEGKFKGKMVCHHPTEVQTPPLKVVQGSDAVVPGLNLDGFGSLSKAKGGVCAHPNFKAPNGDVSIDNQLYRVMGCIRAHQASGISAEVSGAELRNGSHSVVLEITRLNNRLNDPDVHVAIYSSQDPTPFSAAGKPLPNGSLTVIPDRKFWAKARGRIVNGLLTTEATDVTLFTPSNSIMLEQEFRNARLRVSFKSDGTLQGILAGYRPVESYYYNSVAMRNHRFFGDGAANTGGYSCPAVYRALQEHADGLLNPLTGKCEGISAALVLAAVPAYVIK